MLRWRILLGAVFIAALVGLVWLDLTATPGTWLLPLAMLVGLGAAQEMVSLLPRTGQRPLAGIIVGGSLLVIASNAIPLFMLTSIDDRPNEHLGWPVLAFALVLLAAFVAEMSRYERPGGGTTINLALAALGVAYVGLLMSFVVQLRVLGGAITGMVNLLALIMVVKFADIGAYTTGRLFGRHKMAPVISPGKTIEGACGALVFACLGAWLSFTYLPPRLGCNQPQHPLGWIVFGLAVGVAGMLGDLAESLLKRDLGVKDSSTWLPGFGGVLDLIDSILFAAPVAYLCAVLEIT
ncbi:MAG: phosphatidate cytidylyltransferase [Pirellulales bacterium]